MGKAISPAYCMGCFNYALQVKCTWLRITVIRIWDTGREFGREVSRSSLNCQRKIKVDKMVDYCWKTSKELQQAEWSIIAEVLATNYSRQDG